MNPTAIIAEDEPVLREELRRMLEQLWPELRINAMAEDGLQAMRAFDACPPDVLFLDIHMPALSGLDVARHVSGKSHVVFITAYDQYAVSAFEHGAVDYVMKPLSASRLLATVSRLRHQLASTPRDLEGLVRQLAAQAALRKAPLRWINASQGAKVVLITVDEVLFFQSDAKYTRVVTGEHEALIRKPVKDLAEELDPLIFWQIHRSTLVNVNAIAAVDRDLRGRVTLKLKNHHETLPVSAPFTHLFRQM